MVSKLLKNAIITFCVCICESAFGSIFPEAEMICFAGVSLLGKDNIPKTFTVGQLTKHENGELIVAGELLDIPVASVLSCQVIEVVSIEEI